MKTFYALLCLLWFKNNHLWFKTLSMVLLCLPFFASAQTYTPRAGDFLFQDLDCGGLCDAIERVTPGLDGKHFSHIGLVCSVNDSLYVIEAIGKDVHLTRIADFMKRTPKNVPMRLRKAHENLLQPATLFCLAQIGTPYDDDFLYQNKKYYCSELLYDAFMAANQDKPFFTLQPMTFIDPDTKKTFPAWIEYYKGIKCEIPEGKLGCNPGGIANSPFLEKVN
jgi:Permuted papain-like amidase enzyme, YaeF/YiiX, C92 family